MSRGSIAPVWIHGALSFAHGPRALLMDRELCSWTASFAHGPRALLLDRELRSWIASFAPGSRASLLDRELRPSLIPARLDTLARTSPRNPLFLPGKPATPASRIGLSLSTYVDLLRSTRAHCTPRPSPCEGPIVPGRRANAGRRWPRQPGRHNWQSATHWRRASNGSPRRAARRPQTQELGSHQRPP
jgi:hypothetical protein